MQKLCLPETFNVRPQDILAIVVGKKLDLNGLQYSDLQKSMKPHSLSSSYLEKVIFMYLQVSLYRFLGCLLIFCSVSSLNTQMFGTQKSLALPF